MSEVHFEAEGVLEGNGVIRLKKPLPCKEGPVKVIVTPQEPAGAHDSNRAALEALNRLLGEPDNLTPEKWAELERVIEEHPLRIRKGSAA